MSQSWRANRARKRWARMQRRIDWVMRTLVVLTVALAVLGLGRLLGVW